MEKTNWFLRLPKTRRYGIVMGAISTLILVLYFIPTVQATHPDLSAFWGSNTVTAGRHSFISFVALMFSSNYSIGSDWQTFAMFLLVALVVVLAMLVCSVVLIVRKKAEIVENDSETENI